MMGKEAAVIGIKESNLQMRSRVCNCLGSGHETGRLVRRPVHLLQKEGVLGSKQVLDI